MQEAPGFDFGEARFDLESPRDRDVLRFILSQALYGEATGVYCGRSLYAAQTLEAAHFYVRQARQELNHLTLFAEMFRALELEPETAHWVIRVLSAHNDYYPLKVLMEHALGEGMVLDIFRDVLLQTLPEGDPRVPGIQKKLRVICKEEEEHVAWGEKETRRVLAEQPGLKQAFYGLLELQLFLVPFAVKNLKQRAPDHPVLAQLDAFVKHVQERVWRQGQALGFVPEERPSGMRRAWAVTRGLALLARSQFARSRSRLDHTYLQQLGFKGDPPTARDAAPPSGEAPAAASSDHA
ncbi:MAG: ferritin-like domain-containing protein [Myxococcales bacterium]